MLAFLPSVAAFAPQNFMFVPVIPPVASIVMQERSASIPFLKKPPALDGTLPGDVGFDPLGFSTTITELGGDLSYVREAELMHGRQAMLATVGFVFPAVFGKLPGVEWVKDVPVNPLEAQYQLPTQILVQTVGSIFIAEALRSRIIFGDRDGYVPGEHGMNPGEVFDGGLTKSMTPEQLHTMKTKEINNGRLAMIAITGMFFQLQVTGHIWPLL